MSIREPGSYEMFRLKYGKRRFRGTDEYQNVWNALNQREKKKKNEKIKLVILIINFRITQREKITKVRIVRTALIENMISRETEKTKKQIANDLIENFYKTIDLFKKKKKQNPE